MTTHANPVLTGVVYVQGALEGDFPRRTVGRNAQSGDLRLHVHLDEKGLRARSRGYCRAGYSGLIRASLFDGKAWRKFMLALCVVPAKTHYDDNADRARKAWSTILALQALKGRSCVYRDGAFACNQSTASAPEMSKAEPLNVLQTTAPNSAEPKPQTVAECPIRRGSSVTRRRRRRAEEDSRQLRLF